MRLPGLARALALVLCGFAGATVKTPRYHTLPPLREQAEIQNAWTAERKALIPGLLKKYGVDAWLISQREYAEETVFWSLKAAEQFSARRRTTLLFLADNASSPSGGHEYSWIDNTPAVFAELTAVLEAADPARIAVDAARDVSFSSGLHAGELEALRAGLGARWTGRFAVEPMLAVEFIGTMVPGRLAWYRRLMETAWAAIDEAFSERVVAPGRTRTGDVEWWLREKLQALNYTTWFMPSVTVLDETFLAPRAPGGKASPGKVIGHGDMLHVDFGVTALGLNTDTQHLGYVLRPGETAADVPRGLREGLRKANRMQDIVREKMGAPGAIGASGNDVLAACLAQMDREGIVGKVYSHPIGDWGHSAGPVIGMSNLQGGVPVLGELLLFKDMYFSVELLAEHFVPELNATYAFPLEEDVYWDAKTETWEWVYGRQEEFHYVRTLEPADAEAGGAREGRAGEGAIGEL